MRSLDIHETLHGRVLLVAALLVGGLTLLAPLPKRACSVAAGVLAAMAWSALTSIGRAWGYGYGVTGRIAPTAMAMALRLPWLWPGLFGICYGLGYPGYSSYGMGYPAYGVGFGGYGYPGYYGTSVSIGTGLYGGGMTFGSYPW